MTDDTPTEEERAALGVVLGMFSRLQARPAGDPEPAEHVVYRAGADACRFVLGRARPGDPPPDDAGEATPAP